MAALALGWSALGSSSLTGTPAQAAATQHHSQSGHRADRSFGPAQERAAMKQARRSAARVAQRLKLGSGQRLVAKDVSQDADGARHVHYNRTFRGLPVVGGDLIVHETKAGAPKRVSWAAPRAIKVAHLTPRLSAKQVKGSHDRKVIFAAHHRPTLAWASRVTGRTSDGTPVNDVVYTDARTGKRLGVDHLVKNDIGTGNSLYLGSVSLSTTAGGSGWNLVDGDRGGHATYDANNSQSSAKGTLFTDADNTWGDGTTSDRQSAAVDAAYGAARTWDYYLDTFGRNGIADDGQAAYSRVHYGTSYENAFWDDSCFCMTYGDGGSTFNPLVSLDVAGHEMTHGVTANSAGLDYSGDAGGLNESTSDVFGTMVEFSADDASDPGDYLIGETIAKDGTPLRRMDDPESDGASVNCWSSSVAGLDPHYSSGVGNHLFYLLAEGTGAKTIGGTAHDGETCDGTSLTGIGRDDAAAIWYRALTTYWTSTTTYPQAANGQVQAAKDLYGAGSTQCAATVAAWQGVDVTPTTSCS